MNNDIMQRLQEVIRNIGDMALKRRVVEIITTLDIKNNEKILDCGCGEGIYLVTISDVIPDANIYGFDGDSPSIEIARGHLKNKNIDFKVGDICNMPYQNGFFDKVFCSEVLEHVNDDKKAVLELNRIIKTGGKLVITVPNKNYPFLWDPLNKILDNVFNTHIKSGFWAGIWNMHLRLYEVEEISKLVESVGFEIKNIKALTHYSIPFNHIILYGLKNLLNSGVLPKSISNTADKFSYKESKQSKLVKFGYYCLNKLDRLNDNISRNKSSVSILIEAIKR